MQVETNVIRNPYSIREKWRKMVMKNPSLDPTHPSLPAAGGSAPNAMVEGEGDPA